MQSLTLAARPTFRSAPTPTGLASNKHPYDSLWHRMWAYYNFNRSTFLDHYHKRSQVETVFSMVKRKLSSRAPGRSLETQRSQILLPGVAFNVYRLKPRLLTKPNRPCITLT
ncbi:MAG: hypothetical protein IH960_02725 [Chloroflexi bacterium]|nr:hypothetical protein [Chloroflexota bacterium]